MPERTADLGPCRCGASCTGPPSPAMQRLLDDAGEGFTQVTRLPLAGFCCPLCLRVLPDCCASFAHYPAAAAAGRRKTLLCKKCNSFLGAEYEPDAVIMANRSAVTDDVGYEIPGFVM